MHRVHASGTPGTRHGKHPQRHPPRRPDSLSRSRRDALIEEFALRFLGLAAFDRQHVLLGGDGDLVGRNAG
jgi:hypothetical protein